MGSHLRSWVGVLPALVVLVVLATSYLPFISDDALISLRYADHWLQGHGLVWNVGERVEGYSNLLWIVGTTALGATGLDLIRAARLLGFLCTFAAIASVFWANLGPGTRSVLPAVTAALVLSISGPLVVWTVGGLEQPLQAALLAAALALGLRQLQAVGEGAAAGAVDEVRAVDAAANTSLDAWWQVSLLLALLCWTRPDGPLFTVAWVAGWLWANAGRSRGLAEVCRIAALPGAAVLAQLGFRLLYYGDWLPNPAYAKLAPSGSRVVEGLHYVGGGLLWLVGLVLPALMLAALSRNRAQRFLAPSLGLWLGYVIAVGGDSFPARRHFVPVVVVLSLMLGQGLRWAESRGRQRLRSAWVGVAIGLLLLSLGQFLDPQNQRAREERWEWEGQVLGRLLAQAFPEDTLVAVDPAGCVPYFSGLPALDMLGLNDRYLAHHPPDDFGSGFLGHELGDGDYVLDRQPDLVLFCGPAGSARPCFRSGKEMVGDPRFSAMYRLVRLRGEDPFPFDSHLWLRAESSGIGIVRETQRVQVPAYLLMATGRSTARLGPQGRLALPIAPGAPAGIAGLTLAAGRWRLSVVQPLAGARLSSTLRPAGQAVDLGRGAPEIVFDWDGGALDLLLRAAPEASEVWVESVEFTRL